MKRMQTAALVAAMVLGASMAWAKLPPPPPVDPAKKAADDAKKAEAAAKAKQELADAEDRAVKNYQQNMKAAGKPIPKPVAVGAPAPAAPAAAVPGKPGEKPKAEAKKAPAKT
jgi:hypothetical protein